MIDIKIDDNMVFIDAERDGSNFKKITSLDTFRESLSLDRQTYDSGVLPGKSGTKRIIEKDGAKQIFYIHPAHKRKVYYIDEYEVDYNAEHGYTEEDYESVDFPRGDRDDYEYERLLRSNWETITYRLKQAGKFPENESYDIMVPDSLVIAKERPGYTEWEIVLVTLGMGSFINGSEALYRYPAPNVYSGSEAICWGENQEINQFNSFLGVQSIVPSFWASPFNDDLASGRTANTSILRLWREMDQLFASGSTEDEVLRMYHNEFISISKTSNDYLI